VTLDELLDKLALCKEIDGDPEAAHCQADEALLDFIDDEEVRAAFDAIRKWYA
jgi:hypothetical protein